MTPANRIEFYIFVIRQYPIYTKMLWEREALLARASYGQFIDCSMTEDNETSRLQKETM